MFKKNLNTLLFTLAFSALLLVGANPLRAASGSTDSSPDAPIVKTVDQKKPKKKAKSKAVKKTKSAKKGKKIKQAKKKAATKKGVKRASRKKMKSGSKKASTAKRTVRDKSKRQCAAKTAEGARCKRNAAPDSKYCWQHKKMH